MSPPFLHTIARVLLVALSSFNAHAVLSSQERNCVSMYVEIRNLGESTIDTDHWNGVYTLDVSQTSFNASIWRVNDHKWLKYIESHWVLSGENRELFIYESDILFPPIDTTTAWIHESYSDSASIFLYCSASLSPTDSPTSAPTTLPTFSPTPRECRILIVSDETNDPLFNRWLYVESPYLDWRGSPIWQYQDGDIDSNVQHLPHDGWTVYFSDGRDITTYSTGHLNGYYPPLNTPHSFDHTSGDALPRRFTFTCLRTNHPTAAPSTTPTPAPTASPTEIPTRGPTPNPIGGETVSPTPAPTSNPTISPSVGCEVLSIEVQTSLADSVTHDEPRPISGNACGTSFDAVFESALWLQQDISRSNRPTWALDCDDYNTIYTAACRNGYSGSIFYISNQWEIQMYSRNEGCLERFIARNTAAHFVPIQSIWTRESTQHEYTLIMSCLAKIQIDTPDASRGSLVGKKETVYIYENYWFWLSLGLMLLICGLVCFVVYCWKKKQKPIVVYQPQAVKSISAFSPQSEQHLELGQVPNAAYMDHAVALQAAGYEHEEEGSGQENESKSDDEIMLDDDTPIVTMATDGDGGRFGGTASDPRMNPNLKQNVSGDGVQSDKVGGTASDPKMNPNLKPSGDGVQAGVRGTASDPKINPNLKPNVGGDGARMTKVSKATSVTINSEDSDHENDDLWDAASATKSDAQSHKDPDVAVEIIAGNKKLVPAGYHHVVGGHDEDADTDTDEEEMVFGV